MAQDQPGYILEESDLSRCNDLWTQARAKGHRSLHHQAHVGNLAVLQGALGMLLCV